MNPFDVVNSDTSKNNDSIVNSSANVSSKKSSNVSEASSVSNDAKSSAKPTTRKNESNKSRTKDTKWKEEINLLKHQYSTARLNKNDVISLKILQKISGDNSRSKLVDELIHYAKPIILNTNAKRKQYKKLYKYAIKGAEIENKFRNASK